jgi:hypothetical protein
MLLICTLPNKELHLEAMFDNNGFMAAMVLGTHPFEQSLSSFAVVVPLDALSIVVSSTLATWNIS